MRHSLPRSLPLLGALAMLAAPACVDRGAPAAPPAHADLVPFVLTLDAGEAGPDLRLNMVIDLRRPLAAPLLIEATLPAGASLVEGAARELIARPRPGLLSRSLLVRGAAGRRVVVEVSQLSPGRAGARARRSYPPPIDPAPPAWEAIAPLTVGGVPVSEAVKVLPGRR